MNPWLILGVVLAVAAAWFGGQFKGSADERMRWEVKTYSELAEASESARKQEAMWQEVVNGTVRNYEGKVSATRRNLDIALDGLRSRPERAPGVSEAPRPACEGGTGAELSGADAGFLAREAARADTLRAGLEACYAVIDATRK